MLTDVVVAEIGDSLSAAYCGRLLVDAGATVYRRASSGLSGGTGDDVDYANYLHAGKHLVAGSSGPLSAFTDVLARADAAVCDTRETFDELVALRGAGNAGLIVAAVSDYGLTGPDASTPATDLTLQTEAGFAAMHVSQGSGPIVCGVPMSQLAGGVHGAIGVMQGLLAREAGGQNIDVDVSRLEALASLLTFPWNWSKIEDHVPYAVEIKGRGPFVPPMNTLPAICRARDGWVCLSANTPPQWVSLKQMMQLPALDDPRFDQVASRGTFAAELVPILESFTSRYTATETIALAQQHRVPAAPVDTPAAAYLQPPYADRDATFVPAGHAFRQPRPAFRFTTARSRAMETPDGGGATAAQPSAPPAAGGVTAAATPGQPLKGLRLVGFEVFHAGPCTSEYLAGLGAEVIKVEAVNRPDLIRFAGVPARVDRSWERSATFISLNVGKKSITADLSDPVGTEIVTRLLATADVVLDSFVPRTLDSRSLDYDGIRRIRPDVVMVRMPGWGLSGSWADRPAYTQLVESTSGTATLTGLDGEAPQLSGTVFDPTSSLFAVFAALVGIYHRHRTGEGSQAEIALCDTALQFTAPAMIRASQGRSPLARRGNRSVTAAPQGIYRCQEGGWVGLTVVDDEAWAALSALPRAAWAREARFHALDARLDAQDELDELLGTWCAEVTTAEAVTMLRGAGIAAAALGTGAELVDHPQLRARGRVYRADHPFVGPLDYLGYPARMSTLPQLPEQAPAPTLGHDNGEILAELGYSNSDIAELVATGAIGTIPYAKPPAAGT